MSLTPDYDSFAAGYAAGKNQIVYTRLAADLDTPVSLMLKLSGARADAFMLESVTGGEVRGRYSIIGMKPDLIWRCHRTKPEINRQARYDRDNFVVEAADPRNQSGRPEDRYIPCFRRGWSARQHHGFRDSYYPLANGHGCRVSG